MGSINSYDSPALLGVYAYHMHGCSVGMILFTVIISCKVDSKYIHHTYGSVIWVRIPTTGCTISETWNQPAWRCYSACFSTLYQFLLVVGIMSISGLYATVKPRVATVISHFHKDTVSYG